MIEKYIALSKQFDELYGQGLIGIQQGEIQVDTETFKKIVPKNIGIEVENDGNGRIDLTANVEGVTFKVLI